MTSDTADYMQTTFELPAMAASHADAQTASDKGGCLQGIVGRHDEPIDLYCEHAKEKQGLPSNWHIYKWECFPKTGDAIYVAVTGAVCEHFKKGDPSNGRDWKKMDKKTECTVNLPIAEHNTWKQEWERRTGKCSECTGTGQTFASWSLKDGTKYRTCFKCKGTGTPNS